MSDLIVSDPSIGLCLAATYQYELQVACLVNKAGSGSKFEGPARLPCDMSYRNHEALLGYLGSLAGSHKFSVCYESGENVLAIFVG